MTPVLLRLLLYSRTLGSSVDKYKVKRVHCMIQNTPMQVQQFVRWKTEKIKCLHGLKELSPFVVTLNFSAHKMWYGDQAVWYATSCQHYTPHTHTHTHTPHTHTHTTPHTHTHTTHTHTHRPWAASLVAMLEWSPDLAEHGVGAETKQLPKSLTSN